MNRFTCSYGELLRVAFLLIERKGEFLKGSIG